MMADELTVREDELVDALGRIDRMAHEVIVDRAHLAYALKAIGLAVAEARAAGSGEYPMSPAHLRMCEAIERHLRTDR